MKAKVISFSAILAVASAGTIDWVKNHGEKVTPFLPLKPMLNVHNDSDFSDSINPDTSGKNSSGAGKEKKS